MPHSDQMRTDAMEGGSWNSRKIWVMPGTSRQFAAPQNLAAPYRTLSNFGAIDPQMG